MTKADVWLQIYTAAITGLSSDARDCRVEELDMIPYRARIIANKGVIDFLERFAGYAI
jgi:hypothetical protein